MADNEKGQKQREIKWVKINLPSGREIGIRKMRLRDEDIVTDIGLARSGENVDRLLEACTDQGREALQEMLLGDRVAALIEIRKLKSTLYYPQVKCEACQNKWEAEIDLSALRVQTLDGEGLGEDYTFPVELPSGIKLTGRLVRGRDERTLGRIRKEHPDQVMTYLMMLRTKEIEGVKMKTLDWFRELDSDDGEHFRREYDRHDCGYDTAVTLVCPSCGDEEEHELPFDQTFFLGRVRRRKR